MGRRGRRRAARDGSANKQDGASIAQDRGGGGQDRDGAGQDRDGAKQDRDGAKQDRDGAKQDRDGAKQERGRAGQDRDGREKLRAPTSDYTDEQGNVLTLRGSLTAATRAQYARTLAGNPLSREDAWQRGAEFLFERLATRWTIAGAPLEGQRELLARYRAATRAERAWIRDAIRAHCAENFPDVNAP